jgi:uncharacterized repeat protein (TIGR01451 family)
VTVEKTVDTPVLEPGDDWAQYTVTFTNMISTDAVLDWISDTLPSGFEYFGMAAGSDISVDPVDANEPEIVWQGPFTVTGDGILRLVYVVEVSAGPGTHVNTVEAIGGGVSVGPATASVIIPGAVLSLDKDVSPSTVSIGKLVTYDVTISNTSDHESALAVVSDTLPSGFTFEEMDPSSDISQDPVGSTGTIVWTGPFTVPQSGEIHLIYRVRVGGVGDWTNSVVARDTDGQLLDPAESTVTVSLAKVFLPLLRRNYPPYVPPPILLDDDFVAGLSPEWTPFVNLPDLRADDWFWKGDGETWGRYDYDPGEGLDQWGLSMYLGEGAQEWRDYKIDATIRGGKATKTPLVGIWFRGTHQEQFDKLGGDVGGYIFCIQFYGRFERNRVHIGKINPATRKINDIAWIQSLDFPHTDIWNWYTITIEARGDNIKVWIDGYPLFNLTDATWSQGTVGFAVFDGSAGFDDIVVTPLDD